LTRPAEQGALMPNRENHDREHIHGGCGDNTRRYLTFAIALLSFTLVAEVAGGFLTHSLSLLADAGHVFMDLFALGLSLFAASIARLPATSTKTFGWHRAEILAALVNGTALIVLSLMLGYEAWGRIGNPRPILSGPMLVVAVLGFAINVVIAVRLHRHGSGDLNLRAAYLHVLGDTLSSAGVIAAAVVIGLTRFYTIDAIMSMAIGLLILAGAVNLIFKAGHVLLEGVPAGLSLDAVARTIGEVEGVNNVHDLHIWSVCSHIVSLSCHVHIDPKSPEGHDRLVRSLADTLWSKYGILHTTIQVDYESCSDQILTQDMEHRSR
jgi:cobalt-zinc-cadmium efflux system protein